MKIITVDNLREGDVLAKDVLLPDYTVLLGKGTIIKQEFINKLREYFIVTVYIENEKSVQVEEKKEIIEPQKPNLKEPKIKHSKKQIEKLEKDIETQINDKVKAFLEKHINEDDYGIRELAKNANDLIKEVLVEPAVIDKVYDIKERNANIYDHSLTVCTLAVLISYKLELNYENIKDIAVAALLHDFGLRYLSVMYEDYDINLLTRNKQNEYKKHGLFAYTSMKEETWISPNAKELILGHHERKNGEGYPFKRTDLSRDCQIIGICDEFDELICGIGKAKIRVHEAICCIRNYNGIWFDSEIVDAFLDLIAVYPTGTKVRTNAGQIGIVIEQNDHFPERPVIRVLEDKNFKNMTEELTINLVKETKIVIEEVLK